MGRKHNDWLSSFVEYSGYGEAPPRMYFWVGVSTIAGALRRRVWIDQAYFQWYPNLYIVFVAPPGIVSKSTTVDVGMSLLRQVPNIRFGPSVVTWQSLVKSFAEANESFVPEGTINGHQFIMSPLTIVSSEFGNLVNPKDKDMVDMLVNLWDGRSFTKATKMSGIDEVINPWINLVACTTPEWIAGSFPEYMVGGGFTSRCLFVYAETKQRYIAYPSEEVPEGLKEQEKALVHDLEWISVKLAGEYTISPEAIDWGTAWYRRHYETESRTMDPVRFGGYIARKQTQAHKLAMVLAASHSDELVITKADLQKAVQAITDLEPDMHKVFERIGMKQDAVQIDRLVQMIYKRGRVPYIEVYRWVQRYFPHLSDIDDVFATAIRAGYFTIEDQEGAAYFVAGKN